MSLRKVVAGLAAILLASATVASASTLTPSLAITGTYSAAGVLQNAGFLSDGAAHIYRVSLSFTLNNLAANESFGSISGDFLENGAAIPAAGLPITRVAANQGATVKANYAALTSGAGVAFPADTEDAGGNLLANVYSGQFNKDAGPSALDLLAVTGLIDPSNLGGPLDNGGNASGNSDPVTDIRLTMGTGGPFTVGSIFVNWTGTTTQILTFSNAQYLTASSATHQLLVPAINLNPVQVTFTAVPEPASMIMLGLGGLGLVGFARRRRS